MTYQSAPFRSGLNSIMRVAWKDWPALTARSRMYFQKELIGCWRTGIYSFKTEEFEIIELLSRDYDIQTLCQLMGVSRSGYYKWKNRDKSERDINREEIIALVSETHEAHPSHGYRWVAAFLRLNYGRSCSDSYIYKVFRCLGIQSQTKHKPHYRPRKVRDLY